MTSHPFFGDSGLLFRLLFEPQAGMTRVLIIAIMRDKATKSFGLRSMATNGSTWCLFVAVVVIFADSLQDERVKG